LQGDREQFHFGRVAFFGRAIEEYVSMFNLNVPALLNANPPVAILDCPAGPAAFARQGADIGLRIIACDPMFAEEDAEKLRWVVDTDAQSVAKKTVANRQLFHPELTPVRVRRRAMEIFLGDYSSGRSAGRYVAGQLPYLPFEDKTFDLVLSANFLFIYSNIESGGMMENSPFDLAFHRKALAELIRVSRDEVRIYPLRGPRTPAGHNLEKHDYLEPLMQELAAAGHRVELQSVEQRDILGAESMLVISF